MFAAAYWLAFDDCQALARWYAFVLFVNWLSAVAMFWETCCDCCVTCDSWFCEFTDQSWLVTLLIADWSMATELIA